jgi:sulfatase modifying factor 1
MYPSNQEHSTLVFAPTLKTTYKRGSKMKTIIHACSVIMIFVLLLSFGCSKTTEPDVKTVATPSFNLQEGSYTSFQSVEIMCVTDGAAIHYTTDGMEPTTDSPIYIDPIDVYFTTTIKAKCFKDGWEPSATASATYIINTVPPGQMVYVPGGTFNMGDTRGQGFESELPVHTVTLDSFYIGKYEVTQVEYGQYMLPGREWTIEIGLGNSYPAYHVSWYAAIKYCNLCSLAEGLTPVYTINGSTNPAKWGDVPTSQNDIWDNVICNWNANGYRLPTEAEWEFAARGGTNNPDYLYSGSDDFNVVAWLGDNSDGKTHEVGTKAANELGIYDMSGNVGEWCWDRYGSYDSSPQNNPTGPETGIPRLLRGGSWSRPPEYGRVSFRNLGHDNYPHSIFGTGLRLCRTKID